MEYVTDASYDWELVLHFGVDVGISSTGYWETLREPVAVSTASLLSSQS